MKLKEVTKPIAEAAPTTFRPTHFGGLGGLNQVMLHTDGNLYFQRARQDGRPGREIVRWNGNPSGEGFLGRWNPATIKGRIVNGQKVPYGPGENFSNDPTSKPSGGASSWQDPDKQPTQAARPVTGASYDQGLLRKGSRGAGVKELQQKLGMPESEQDGIFGPKTEAAVRKLQQSQGIKVDGIVGPETRGAIAKLQAPEPKVEPKTVTPKTDKKVSSTAMPSIDTISKAVKTLGMEVSDLSSVNEDEIYLYVNPTEKLLKKYVNDKWIEYFKISSRDLDAGAKYWEQNLKTSPKMRINYAAHAGNELFGIMVAAFGSVAKKLNLPPNTKIYFMPSRDNWDDFDLTWTGERIDFRAAKKEPEVTQQQDEPQDDTVDDTVDEPQDEPQDDTADDTVDEPVTSGIVSADTIMDRLSDDAKEQFQDELDGLNGNLLATLVKLKKEAKDAAFNNPKDRRMRGELFGITSTGTIGSTLGFGGREITDIPGKGVIDINTVPDNSPRKPKNAAYADAHQERVNNLLARIKYKKIDDMEESRIIQLAGVDMKKKLDEASISINGADSSEVAEILRMMQLAGADGAKVVDDDDINPKPMPMPTPGGCGMDKPDEPGMGDMIRMVSSEDEEIEEADYDGGFADATTEPDEEVMDLDAAIRDGDDLHRRKKSYPATAGGDNPMNTESLESELKTKLMQALAEKKAKPDFLDMDKDGDKKEPMKKAIKDKESKGIKAMKDAGNKKADAEANESKKKHGLDVKKPYKLGYDKGCKPGFTLDRKTRMCMPTQTGRGYGHASEGQVAKEGYYSMKKSRKKKKKKM